MLLRVLGKVTSELCYEQYRVLCELLSLCRPKLAVVVVKKRINTRIFQDERGQLRNPPPGTVVDTEVTKPEWCVIGALYLSLYTLLF